MDWFLYDTNLRNERDKLFVFLPKSNNEEAIRYIAVLLRFIFKAV